MLLLENIVHSKMVLVVYIPFIVISMQVFGIKMVWVHGLSFFIYPNIMNCVVRLLILKGKPATFLQVGRTWAYENNPT